MSRASLKAPEPTLTTREAWLIAFVTAARPSFERVGHPLPREVRVSIGFPSKGIRSKTIGECWSRESSTDAHFEIFLRPSLDSSSRIADVLTHELVHAAVGLDAKHGPRFRKVAAALGLEGKMTATVAGERWREWADPILKVIGPLPAAPMHDRVRSTEKKQATRMLKLVCTHCGFACRTTRQHIDTAPEGLICPIPTCDGDLELKGAA